MDANSGEPWSEADISDLKNELDHGAWPHSPSSSGGNFVGRSPAFRIHIRFTVEGLKVISREASVTSRRRP